MLPSGNPVSDPSEMLNGKTLHQLPSVEDATFGGTTTARCVRSAVKHGAVEVLPVQQGPWLLEGEESSRRRRAVLQGRLCWLARLRAPSRLRFGRRKASMALQTVAQREFLNV